MSDLDDFADFFDGQQATAQRVHLALDLDRRGLTLRPPEADPIHWPFDSLRAMRDDAGKERLVLTSLGQPLARIIVTNAAQMAAVRQHAPHLFAAPAMRGKGRLAKWSAAAFASVGVIVFVLVPLMADQLARVLPTAGEVALGDATFEQIQTAMASGMADLVPVCDAPEGVDAIEAMVTRLGGDRLDLPYPLRVTVLDHEMVNAFALPGGRVIFFRGLIDEATDPDQVAAVLAHEIGHVVARDPTRIALRSAGSLGVLGLVFGDFAGGAAVLFLVEQLIRADYTREAEAAADAVGINMLLAADVDPQGLADLFTRLLDKEGDATGIADHFASHPALGNRIDVARRASETAGPTRPALTDEAWQSLQTVCD